MNLLFNCLLDYLMQGIMLIDDEYRVVVWNAWMERVTGLAELDVLGKEVGIVCPRFAEPKFRRMLEDTINHGRNCFCAGVLHNTFVFPSNGISAQDMKRQNMQIEPFYYQEKTFVLVQIIDITAQYRRIYHLQSLVKKLTTDVQAVKAEEERVRHTALHDSLTGLSNRKSLFDYLAYLTAHAKRQQELLAVLFVDLDGFKTINDTYGHSGGDAMLKEVAVRLKRTVRQHDIVARIGGDEFIVVLPNIIKPDKANHIAHQIRSAIAEEFYMDGNRVKITASIGISLYPSDADEIENLLNKADQAMYSAKMFGKNDCRFFSAKNASEI